MAMHRKRRPDGTPDAVTGERIYSAAEAEFLLACDAYRKRIGLAFLTCTDCLRVLLDLGYRRPRRRRPPGTA